MAFGPLPIAPSRARPAQPSGLRGATVEQVGTLRETAYGTGPMNRHPRGHKGRHMGGDGRTV